MMTNVLLFIAEAILKHFWNSPRVKEFILYMLEKYAKSTDNDIDDIIVNVVKNKLFRA